MKCTVSMVLEFFNLVSTFISGFLPLPCKCLRNFSIFLDSLWVILIMPNDSLIGKMMNWSTSLCFRGLNNDLLQNRIISVSQFSRCTLSSSAMGLT